MRSDQLLPRSTPSMTTEHPFATLHLNDMPVQNRL